MKSLLAGSFVVRLLEALIIFEDEHLLVINKPAGMNTHSPSPFAGEGIYEWLKKRETRWANLAIIHRLDKETSGVLVFGKTPTANRSLTEQFTRHEIRKKYRLLTDRPVRFENLVARTSVVRVGEKYASRPMHVGGEIAETHFRFLEKKSVAGKILSVIEAEPITGRTHQIRVHAAENGFPIYGDTLYGGSAAARVFLHAQEIFLKHPQSGEAIDFSAPPEFDLDPRFQLRRRVLDFSETNAFRLIHGASDGWPGWHVDRLGDYLLSQSEQPLNETQIAILTEILERDSLRGAYHKNLSRHIRGASIQETSPQLVLGEKAPEEILIRENNATFSLRFNEGYSVGIFLDQRENRRRLLSGYVAPEFFLGRGESDFSAPDASKPLREISVLNTFAYTCAFSVCAARAGARVTSLDLSKKYLEWGKRNFALNDVNPAEHDFIFGDTFDWFRRLAKKNRKFDIVLLDPPTFSQSKEHGVFRADKDYGELVEAALGVLGENGVLFCSTNAAELKSEKFMEMVEVAVASAKRRIIRSHYVPQPPDFPVSRQEPAYLKTVWLRLASQS